MPTVSHRIHLADPNAHLLGVETTIAADAEPLPRPLVLHMPVWTPGSYLVREYARHVEAFGAESAGKPLRVRKVRKNAWSVEHDGAREVTVRYRLYANDLTVRTNHVDATHAYWNGAATFLTLDAARDAGSTVTVSMPEGWSVATALPKVAGASEPTFAAASFDELCDSPFECGRLVERTFTSFGKEHRIAAWDNEDARTVDWDRVTDATRTIVETEARLLAGDREPASALPYDRYVFLWHVSPRGRGGLEHRASATLLAQPDRFGTRTGWLDVLSLVAHELFHLWNVKRIRPEGLFPYRYEQENHTRLLWWFEGGTSYYDWRVLRLAKLATPAEYLHHLAEEIARLEETPGARLHALEDSSYDAWIKAYRPDENSLNTSVSYYLKGEIVCALLDLEIRHRSHGRASLDDVLRHLWREYGAKERPVPEAAMAEIFAEVAGVSLEDRFATWIRGTDRIAYDEALAHAGLAFERVSRDSTPRSHLGVRTSTDHGQCMVDVVVRGSAAHRAGIDPHDEIVAIGERRVIDGRVDLALAAHRPGANVRVLVTRDGRLRTLEAVLDAAPPNEARIVARADATAEQKALYAAWLGDDFSTAPAPRERR